MPAPQGTITFLFSDIEGSTRLWERDPGAMQPALARHDAILHACAAASNGYVFKTIGDAFCIAFDTAPDALAAAATAQRQLDEEAWGETGPLRVRMALHTGAAEFRDGDYFGNPLNRVARILASAHGGQVLLSFSAEELVRDFLPAGIRLRDIGEHRLRDLNRSEHLFQLVIDGIASEFPPLRFLEVTPNNLPSNLSTFVGRETHVTDVRELLETSRLITLTGTGGTGKTRLSLQVASQVLGEFSGGVWFVEFATLTDPLRLWETVAATLGIREEPEIPIQRTLARYVSKRKMLLLFDNCEHVLNSAATLAAELLRAGPALQILATSRHSLGISGERTWSVPPLTILNPARDLFQVPDIVATVSQYEAVRLFIDRAAAAKPGFEVTRQNAPSIAQICWRLDGIPLAIELAAARAKVLSPEQIATRLDDRFRLLTGGNRSVLPHQQTLRALIDWSYDLLSEDERTLFRRLGVFGGGRTLEAIEDVCTGNGVDAYEALDLLQQLVDKSLLSVETGADGSVRYTMIESVWHYTQEKLETSGEVESLRDRHLACFLSVAEALLPQLEGSGIALALERIDTERSNFRLALDWAARRPHLAVKGLRIAGVLTRYWEIRGNLEEACKVFQSILHAPGALEPTRERAAALAGAGRIAWCRDRAADAQPLYEQSIAIYESLGDTAAATLNGAFLGFVKRNLTVAEDIRACFEPALELGKASGDRLLIAIALSGLGTLAVDEGRFEEALRMKEESLAIYRAVGDKWIAGYILWGVAKASNAAGDPVRARSALAEWVTIARELGNRWSLPYVLQAFADILLLEGNAAAAARALGAAESGREALAITLDAVDQAELDRSILQLETTLANPARRREWEIGRGQSLWEAVDDAIHSDAETQAAA